MHAVVFSSWLVRVPQVKRDLGLSDSALGTALAGAPVGAVAATLLSLWLLPRWGSHRLVPVCVAGYAISGVAIGLAGSAAWLFVSLTCLGFFQGGLDVGMNTQAATVERLVAAPIMPRFHGMRSLGVLLGALVGAACASAGVGLALQLTVIGVVVVAVVEPLTRYLVHRAAPTRSATAVGESEPRRTATVLVLAAVSFAAFLCEGTAADWSADYLHGVVGARSSVAALGYAGFTAAMAAMRLSAAPLYHRFPIRRLLSALSIVAAAGVAVMLVTADVPTSVIGLTALGLGVALLTPAAMTAAYPCGPSGTSGSSIAVVAAAGWLGLLVGPPTIGHLAQSVGLSAALIVVPVVITLAAIAVRCTHAFDAADQFRRDNAGV